MDCTHLTDQSVLRSEIAGTRARVSFAGQEKLRSRVGTEIRLGVTAAARTSRSDHSLRPVFIVRLLLSHSGCTILGICRFGKRIEYL